MALLALHSVASDAAVRPSNVQRYVCVRLNTRVLALIACGVGGGDDGWWNVHVKKCGAKGGVPGTHAAS